jgi:hypothetical protein
MNFPELACRLTDGNKENHPGSSLIRKSEHVPCSSIPKCDLHSENINSVTIAKDILPLFHTSSSEMLCSISKPSTISSRDILTSLPTPHSFYVQNLQCSEKQSSNKFVPSVLVSAPLKCNKYTF